MNEDVSGRIGAYAGPGLSASLQQSAARFNSEAPHSYRPQSTLAQIGLSPLAQNASAPSMQGRYNEFTGSVMPNTMSGASQQTGETALKLRFAGDGEM